MSQFVKLEGNQMVVNGKPLILKGAGLGGWMNQENFISGYTGHEFQVRAAMKEVLGSEKCDFFYDKYLEYFFGEEDAKFYASLGLNCIRLPINYRHFEDDLKPRVFKPEGLKHLDRVINLCAKYGIYTVIDLHALPGGHNMAWHSDSGIHRALFWEHMDFQDRAVMLWEKLAEHYRDNVWVAGYNPANEPADEEHYRLIAFYERVEKAIRAVDPNHLLFLDGNTFGADTSHFTSPLPASVYACHDYSTYGFPNAPLYLGTGEQKAELKASFDRKAAFARKIGGPVWNGEFGPVYQNKDDGYENWEELNEARYRMLGDQLRLYADSGNVSWSIWTYKDIGFQGMTYVNPSTPYMKLLAPFLKKKKLVVADRWGVDDRPIRHLFDPLRKWIIDAAPTILKKYPNIWNVDRHLSRGIRNTLLSEEMVKEYAEYFRGKSFEELDELAKSFSYENCIQRQQLNNILQEDARRVVA